MMESEHASVLLDLASVDVRIDSLDDLINKTIDYRNAIPVLLKWLPLVQDIRIKKGIVRALTVKWAKPRAAALLIAEFKRIDDPGGSVRWAIGNALSVVANDTVFEDLSVLVRDTGYGQAREMLAVALGNMQNPKADDLLLDLLDDDEVAGHAIIALGKRKAMKAYSRIADFRDHPKSWIRKEAKKALAKLDAKRREEID